MLTGSLLRALPNASTVPATDQLWAWYKSNTGVTGSGSTVSAWADQSGNGHNLSTVSGSEPSLAGSAINGLPAIENLTTKYLSTSSNLPKLANGGTVFVVGLQHSSDTAFGAFINSSDSIWINRKNSTNTIAAESANGSIMLGPVQSVSDDVFYTIRLRITPTDCYLAVNNNTETTTARDSTAIEGLTDSPIVLFSDYGSHNGKKQIAEVLVYTRELSGSEITDIENYLRTKYAHY